MGEASIYEKADLARPKSVAEPVAEPQPVESQSAAARDDGRPPVGEIAVSMEATPPAAEVISAPEAAASSRDHHREKGSVIDNLGFLTEIPRLSDAARRALIDVPLDADLVRASQALVDAGLTDDEISDALTRVGLALNAAYAELSVKNAQVALVAEAPAVTVSGPEVAPETVKAEAPAESAAVLEEEELSRLAKELGLSEQARQALEHVDLRDATAVRGALSNAGVGRGEIQRIQHEIAQRMQPAAEASAMPPAVQPEQRWRMPRLALPPRIAEALARVDLRNPDAVRAALAKFGPDARRRAGAALSRFRRAVDAAVARLPKKPAAQESVVQPAQQQPAEVVVEPELEVEEALPRVATEVAAPSEDPQAAFSQRVLAAWRRIQDATGDPALLDKLRADAVREQRTALAWRPELGRQDVRAAEAALLDAVRDRAMRTKGGTVEPTVSPGIPTHLERLTGEYWQEQAKRETPEKTRRAQARKSLEAAEAAQRRVGTLEREWQSLTAFFEDIGTLEQLRKDLTSARRDARYNRGENRQRAQESAREIESQIANYPTSVDDLLRRVNFPAELRRTIEAARAGKPIGVEESGAVGEHARALYEGLVNDLLGGERPSAASAEIPAPDRGAREAPAQTGEAPTVDAQKVQAVASRIQSGELDPAAAARYLAETDGQTRDREVLTLQLAVDQLVEEVQRPGADLVAAARTKENLKKLGFALVGIATLAGVSLIIKAIEGAISETFKIAES